MNVLTRALLSPIFSTSQRVSPATDPAPSPQDVPYAAASGLDPDRVLLLGPGPATGSGAVSHHVALPGYLAHHLTALTGRGSQVAALTGAPRGLDALNDAVFKKVLYNWDVIVVTLGPLEVKSLMAPRTFDKLLTRLLTTVAARSHPSTRIVITSPLTRDVLAGSRDLGRALFLDHALTLSNTARHVAANLRNVTHLALSDKDQHGEQLSSSPPYEAWARGLAEHLNPLVDAQRKEPLSPQAARARPQPAVVRVEALFQAGLAEEPPSEAIRLITERARHHFDTHGVSFNLLLSDRQRTYTGTQGDGVDIPLTESFCVNTIRSDSALIVPDSRISEHPVPQNDIRFYAGYPIHTTNGVRIGAICVWDYEPRAADAVSAEVLRDFAIEIEKELAGHSGLTL